MAQMKTAEDYLAEALVTDRAKQVEYDPETAREPLEQWLQRNAPSCLSSEDGIGWIWVQAPKKLSRLFRKLSLANKFDLDGLMQAWEDLQASGRTINFQSIKEIAVTHGVTSGKWFFHVSTGLSVDHMWSIVAKGVVGNRLCPTAKVSPSEPGEQCYRHVLLMYNDDFSNEDEVMELEDRIRREGIKAQLLYKPDVFTYIGIYRRNQWGLRPTLYKSDFDILAGQSKIESFI